MKLSSIFGTACVLAFFTTVSAHAATLASYPFTGSSLTSTDTDLTSAATAIALGIGLTDPTRFAAANGNPSPALRVNADETDGTSFATANTAGDYFTFSVTPAANDALTLDTLSFDLAVNSALIGSNVRVEVSGTGNAFVTLPGSAVSSFSTTTFTTETVDLTPANTALAAGLPVYLRFVVYDNANNANGYTGFDNITVTGTVAAIVPEPGTNALVTLGALAAVGSLVLRRQRATV